MYIITCAYTMIIHSLTNMTYLDQYAGFQMENCAEISFNMSLLNIHINQSHSPCLNILYIQFVHFLNGLSISTKPPGWPNIFHLLKKLNPFHFCKKYIEAHILFCVGDLYGTFSVWRMNILTTVVNSELSETFLLLL